VRLAVAAAARSTGGRLALLGAMVVVVWLVTAAVAALTDASSSYGMALWSGLRHLFDPGSLGDDETTAQRIVGVTQVFTGLIFLAGVAFTVLADGVDRGLRRLSDAQPHVTTTGHLLVIGSGHVRDAFLDALSEATEQPPFDTVVTLSPSRDDGPPQRATRPYRLVERIGAALDPAALAAAGAADAGAVVIAGGTSGDPDVADLASLEAASALAEQLPDPPPLVAVHVERADNVNLVWPALPAAFDAVPGDRNLGAILAMGIALPAYPSVLGVGSGVNDSRLCVVDADGLVGVPFGATLERFTAAVPLGLVRGDEARYAPAPDTSIAGGDRLVLLANNPERARERRDHASTTPPSSAAALEVTPVAPDPGHVLIVGWSEAGADLLRELPDAEDLTVLATLDEAPPGVPASSLLTGDPRDTERLAAAIDAARPAIVVVLGGSNGGSDAIGVHARATLIALKVARIITRPEVTIVVELDASEPAQRLRAADPRIRVISRGELVARALLQSCTERAGLEAEQALAHDRTFDIVPVRCEAEAPVLFADAHRALLADGAVPLVLTRDGEEVDLLDPAAATVRPGDGLLLLRRRRE
jgi:hypothetical protein